MSDSFATQLTVVCQALLSLGFSRQEYWSGLPFPFPGNLPVPGIEPPSPALAGYLGVVFFLFVLLGAPRDSGNCGLLLVNFGSFSNIFSSNDCYCPILSHLFLELQSSLYLPYLLFSPQYFPSLCLCFILNIFFQLTSQFISSPCD